MSFYISFEFYEFYSLESKFFPNLVYKFFYKELNFPFQHDLFCMWCRNHSNARNATRKFSPDRFPPSTRRQMIPCLPNSSTMRKFRALFFVFLRSLRETTNTKYFLIQKVCLLCQNSYPSVWCAPRISDGISHSEIIYFVANTWRNN